MKSTVRAPANEPCRYTAGADPNINLRIEKMNERIQYFGQDEYSRILDQHNARARGLSQAECERILIDAGASYEQAKNGSYVYLHHSNHLKAKHRTTQDEYDQILDDFDARNIPPKECIRHLEEMGFSYGQAKTAVYKYRVSRNLIGKRF
ncbi:MAG: hypothetical protein AABY44_04165 [Nitrospirota bacterium]